MALCPMWSWPGACICRPSPCLTRVKALEAAGVIERYVALVNAKNLGLGLNVFISISLKTQSKEGAGRL